MAQQLSSHVPLLSGLGLPVRIPGVDLLRSSSMLWKHPTYKKKKKTGTEVGSKTYSSSRKRKIDNRFISGPIFLIKKKMIIPKNCSKELL